MPSFLKLYNCINVIELLLSFVSYQCDLVPARAAPSYNGCNNNGIWWGYKVQPATILVASLFCYSQIKLSRKNSLKTIFPRK